MMRPWSSLVAPDTQRSRVVLPAPERPITATSWPGAIVRDTRSRATVPPKALLASCNVRSGAWTVPELDAGPDVVSTHAGNISASEATRRALRVRDDPKAFV